MQEQIANVVYPVITYGLNLKERLERGEHLDMLDEQAALKGRLLSDNDATRFSDYGSDKRQDDSVISSRSSADGRRSMDTFLGIRYALVCWLDELFIANSPWGAEWNEHKLETDLYRSNDRAWLFWEQAKRAESRQGSDALEVFFLCVMLGFRGEWRDYPDKLQAWVNSAQARLAQSMGKDFAVPPEIQAPVSVPPLHGRARLQRMLLVAGSFALVVIGVGVFFIVVAMAK
jgi:type VI secretion system protein ImpK